MKICYATYISRLRNKKEIYSFRFLTRKMTLHIHDLDTRGMILNVGVQRGDRMLVPPSR